MRNILVFFTFATLFASCVFDNQQVAEHYFEGLPQWDSIAKNYQENYPEVDKYLKSDTSESRQVVRVDWETELHLFKKADVNKLNLIPKYTLDTLVGEFTGKTTYRLTANSSSQPVQLAEYVLDKNNQWESVHFIKNNENLAFQSQQELWLTRNLNYRIVTRQKVNLVFETDMVIEGSPVGTDREYMGLLNLNGEQFLRFRMYKSVTSEGTEKWFLQNGDERIELESAAAKNDSSVLKFPIFPSEFRYKMVGDTLVGKWHNFDKGNNYTIEFSAAPYFKSRFLDEISTDSLPNLAGKWQVTFTEDDGEQYPAIGMFEQRGNELFGTFATETGDYRHLEGFVTAASEPGKFTLYLSTLDGAHAFHFRATVSGETIENGVFASGTHYLSYWTAKKDDNASLRNPEDLTFLKPGYESLEFTFPDLNGENVSLSDAQFENKVVLITITGTWCPNCKDETNFLKEVYKNYRAKGVEVVALQFERSEEYATAKAAVEAANRDLPVPYTQLIAGKAGRESAGKKLPMLNHVMSYPTLLILDKNHDVQKIHTGFYGPSTGSYYTDFVTETNALIEELLAE